MSSLVVGGCGVGGRSLRGVLSPGATFGTGPCGGLSIAGVPNHACLMGVACARGGRGAGTREDSRIQIP